MPRTISTETIKKVGEQVNTDAVERKSKQIFYDDNRQNNRLTSGQDGKYAIEKFDTISELNELTQENLFAWQRASEFLKDQVKTAIDSKDVKGLFNVNYKFNQWFKKAENNPNITIEQMDEFLKLRDLVIETLADIFNKSKDGSEIKELPNKLASQEAKSFFTSEKCVMQKIRGIGRKLCAAMSLMTVFSLVDLGTVKEALAQQTKQINIESKQKIKRKAQNKIKLKTVIENINNNTATNEDRLFLLENVDLKTESDLAYDFIYNAPSLAIIYKEAGKFNELFMPLLNIACEKDPERFLCYAPSLAIIYKEAGKFNELFMPLLNIAGEEEPKEFLYNAPSLVIIYKEAGKFNELFMPLLNIAGEEEPKEFLYKAPSLALIYKEAGKFNELFMPLLEEFFASCPEEGIRNYKNLLDEINEPQL